MKTLWNYKFTILLLVIVAFTWKGINTIISPVEIETTGASKVTITAEDVERILELNGASVKVTIETDTTFVSVSANEMLGLKLNVDVTLWETEKAHRLNEVRTWLIKAGTTNFDFQKTKQGYTLYLHAPSVTSREHLTENYQVLKRVGVWNPVTLKQLELQSRAKAVQSAKNEGLLTEAKLSIENALYGILPSDVTIKWKKNEQ